MIKKLLRWRIDLGIRVYNWGYPYTVVFRFGINIQIRFNNWLYPKDFIPLIEKIKNIFSAHDHLLKTRSSLSKGVIYD